MSDIVVNHSHSRSKERTFECFLDSYLRVIMSVWSGRQMMRGSTYYSLFLDDTFRYFEPMAGSGCCRGATDEYHLEGSPVIAIRKFQEYGIIYDAVFMEIVGKDAVRLERRFLDHFGIAPKIRVWNMDCRKVLRAYANGGFSGLDHTLGLMYLDPYGITMGKPKNTEDIFDILDEVFNNHFWRHTDILIHYPAQVLKSVRKAHVDKGWGDTYLHQRLGHLKRYWSIGLTNVPNYQWSFLFGTNTRQVHMASIFDGGETPQGKHDFFKACFSEPEQQAGISQSLKQSFWAFIRRMENERYYFMG